MSKASENDVNNRIGCDEEGLSCMLIEKCVMPEITNDSDCAIVEIT